MGHPRPSDLARVHQVASDGGCGLDDGSHRYSGLEQLVAHDESDVAGTQHDHPVARLDTVHIHEGLHSARAIDAGQVVAGKGQRLLGGSGGHDEALRFELQEAPVPFGQDDAVGVVPEHSGAEQHLDAAVLDNLSGQLRSYVDAAGGRELVLATEEHMGLFHQLPAGGLAAVHEHHLCPQRAGRVRGREPGGAGTHYKDLRSAHGALPSLPVSPPACLLAASPRTRGRWARRPPSSDTRSSSRSRSRTRADDGAPGCDRAPALRPRATRPRSAPPRGLRAPVRRR